MANRNAPHGLNPYGYLDGSSWNSQARLYRIPSTDGNAYAVGDVVKSATGADSTGTTNVVIAAAGDVPRGAIVGIVVAPTVGGNPVSGMTPNLNLQTIPATKAYDYYVMVADDPSIIFEVQGNNTGTVTISSNNANIVTAALGTNTVSQTQLNTASLATTNTLQLKVLGQPQRPGVDNSAYAPFLVMFNIHEFKGSTGTTGV